MLRRSVLSAVCVAASWLAVAAQPAPAVQVGQAEPQPVESTVIAGWTGGEPAAAGVGIDRDEAVTAAFTSTDGPVNSLWVSDRPVGGDWQGTFELATGVDVGSADFAESRTGAAVLAWDSTTVEGGTRLMVSVRAATLASWSIPTTLTTDNGSAPGA